MLLSKAQKDFVLESSLYCTQHHYRQCNQDTFNISIYVRYCNVPTRWSGSNRPSFNVDRSSVARAWAEVITQEIPVRFFLGLQLLGQRDLFMEVINCD